MPRSPLATKFNVKLQNENTRHTTTMAGSITVPTELNGTDSPRKAESNWLEVVERQVRGLKFGSVEITVHEGRVVQVETSVKVRFDKS